MSISQVNFQVVDATDVKIKDNQGLQGVFFVAHSGAERFRSHTQPVAKRGATFNENVSFVVPEELDEIKLQLWGEYGPNAILLGEEDIDPEDQGKQKVKLLNQNGSKVGKLNIDMRVQSGSLEDFGTDQPLSGVEGTRSIDNFSNDVNNFQTYDPDGQGVGPQELSRGLFGNQQQQYETPPPQPGYQAPRSIGGKSRSTAGVVKKAAGVAVLVGLGYLWYKRRQHKKNKKLAKKQRKYERKQARKNGVRGIDFNDDDSESETSGEYKESLSSTSFSQHNNYGYPQQTSIEDMLQTSNTNVYPNMGQMNGAYTGNYYSQQYPQNFNYQNRYPMAGQI